MFDQLTQELIIWIQAQPLFLIYFYFFLISYLENVVPPVPGDVLVAFAGYLVAEQVLDFTTVFTLTIIGSTIGFYHVYYLGQKWGYSIYNKNESHWILKVLDIKYLDKGRDWMSKYGQGVVLANRFLAGTRSIISLVAGMSHLPKLKTLISSVVSSVLWNAILIGAGWLVHKNWQLIGTYLANYGKVVIIFILIFVAYKWFKGRNKSKDENKFSEHIN